MSQIFCTSGPVPPDSPVYVERAADKEILQHLLAMNYVQLIQARHMGKTGVAYRLRAQLAEGGYTIAYIDAESLDCRSEAGWYQDLYSRLTPQLADLVEQELPQPNNSQGFREFLRNLATQVAGCSRCLAIVLDEIGSIPEDFSENFFRVLREVFTVREIESHFKCLTFILVGAFDPRDLIKDPRISPFNVAQRVALNDFYRHQVRQLVDFLEVTGDDAAAITNRIYYWTSGQPYLTQRMCAFLEEGLPVTNEGADQVAEMIWREDTNHLLRIFEELGRNSKAREYLKRILEGKAIRFAPAVNRLQAKLALIGVIKTDESGYCTVRNRIYEEALKDYFAGKATSLPLETHPVESVPPSKARRENPLFEGRQSPTMLLAFVLIALIALAGIVFVFKGASPFTAVMAVVVFIALFVVGIVYLGFVPEERVPDVLTKLVERIPSLEKLLGWLTSKSGKGD